MQEDRRETLERENTNHSHPDVTTNGETKKNNKKTGAGGDLGEVANEGVRVEGDGRVQDEERLGETQTTHGLCVSPAPGEKKKKRHATTATKKQPNNKRNRERSGNDSHRGRVLKGEIKAYKNLCFQAKTSSEPIPQEK